MDSHSTNDLFVPKTRIVVNLRGGDLNLQVYLSL
jgi:hypothetical protein